MSGKLDNAFEYPVALKERTARFRGFGSSILSRDVRGNHRRFQLPEKRLACRKLLRENCPVTPGVYGWIDRDEQLIYVGKSKALRKRLLSYFAKSPADTSASRIVQHGVRIVWEPVSHELLALLREQELIYRWRPDFNKQGQPTRTQPAYLCIGSGIAPNAFLARRIPDKASHVFGPVSGTGRLRDAIVAINHVFELRDCPDKTGFEYKNQLRLFDDGPATASCIRFELGSCPGPCAALCSSARYRQHVERAVAFLSGADVSVLDRLADEMAAASSAFAFETAAIKRDYLHQLKWLDRRMSGLRGAYSRLNGLIPVAGQRKRRSAWIVLKGGRLTGTLQVPQRPCEVDDAVAQLSAFASRPFELPSNVLEMNLQLIVIAWLRKNPGDESRLISFEQALRFCERVDSGEDLSGSPQYARRTA